MRVCLFVDGGLSSRNVLKEALSDVVGNITYIAYMSHGNSGGADACIKAFALVHEIQSCPFLCGSFEQLAGIGKMFDKCIVVRSQDDLTLEQFATGLAGVFPLVEVICYNPVVARHWRQRVLSSIPEEEMV
jgi:hypothetical protein